MQASADADRPAMAGSHVVEVRQVARVERPARVEARDDVETFAGWEKDSNDCAGDVGEAFVRRIGKLPPCDGGVVAVLTGVQLAGRGTRRCVAAVGDRGCTSLVPLGGRRTG